MKLTPEKIEDWEFLAKSDKESLEARSNLLGFFEVLIDIDQQLKSELLAISSDKSNNDFSALVEKP